MDAHELWQDNKRWILGVVLGVLVFWIAGQVIAGLYGRSAVERRLATAQAALKGQSFYAAPALAAAQREREELDAARARLQAALVFQPGQDFVLESKVTHDLHWDEVNRRVRRALIARAEALGVELPQKNLEWPPTPPTREETQIALVGLSLGEQVATRLLDAHERVREADATALGLVGVDLFQVQPARAAKRPAARKPDEGVDPDSLVQEERVKIKVRARRAARKPARSARRFAADRKAATERTG